MSVSEGVLVSTFECLIDQLHELYDKVDIINNNLAHHIMQSSGVIPAKSFAFMFEIHKDFDGFECECLLIKSSSIIHSGNAIFDRTMYCTCSTESVLMIRKRDESRFDFRDILNAMKGSSVFSKDTTKIWLFKLPLILVPIQECWLLYGSDNIKYEKEVMDIIVSKKDDLKFKVSLADIEHHLSFIDIPREMLVKALEIYWDLTSM